MKRRWGAYGAREEKAREFGGCDLVILVTVARSGSTLLRLILDAHPQIACPGEAEVPHVIEKLTRLWTIVCGEADHAHSTLPSDADELLRRAILGPLAYHCRCEGKQIYCDKSLSSIRFLPSVHALFPHARYLLLFRRVMDVIASGLEGSPWGFPRFGYQPFVEGSTDNWVAGLARHWHWHTEQALQWEAGHRHLCHRVIYEDLVRHPAETMQNVYQFLDVADDAGAVTRALGRPTKNDGPGDYKVRYTTEITSDSIGRGRRVPVSLLPSPVLDSVNDHLVALGYGALDEGWNTALPSEPRGVSTVLWRELLVALMISRSGVVGSRGVQTRPRSVAVIAEDAEDLRWVMYPESGGVEAGAMSAEVVVIGRTQDLVLLMRNEENAGVLIDSGRIRVARGDTAAGNGNGWAALRQGTIEALRLWAGHEQPAN